MVCNLSDSKNGNVNHIRLCDIDHQDQKKITFESNERH